MALTWSSLNSWSAKVPVPFGEQTLQFEAYDFQGKLIATDSILVESTVSDRPLEDYLRISEIHYHPADGPPGSVYDDANFEFIELTNIGPVVLDLTDARFAAGTKNQPAAQPGVNSSPRTPLAVRFAFVRDTNTAKRTTIERNTSTAIKTNTLAMKRTPDSSAAP